MVLSIIFLVSFLPGCQSRSFMRGALVSVDALLDESISNLKYQHPGSKVSDRVKKS
jgi:hypothetical protein